MRTRRPLHIPFHQGFILLTVFTIFLPRLHLFAESVSSGTANLDDLYKHVASFDFRNDRVIDLSNPELKPFLEAAADEAILAPLLRGKIPLKALWAIAFVRNPDLESFRSMVRSRSEMYPQTMYVDALAAQYRSFIQGIQTRTSSSGMAEGVELLYPGPGVLSFNGRIARLEVDMAMEEYGMRLRDVAAELFSMAAERESIRRSIAVMDDTIDVLTAFEASLKSRFTTDRAMYPELSRLTAERSRMMNERNSMKRMNEAILPEINRYLGRDSTAPLGDVLFPLPDTILIASEPVEKALGQRQELRAQRITIGILKTLLSLKRRATLAPLSPGFIFPKFSNSPDSDMRQQDSMGTTSSPDPLQSYKRSFSTMVDTSPRVEFGGQAVYLRELSRRIEAETQKLSEMENALRASLLSAGAQFENARQSLFVENSSVIPTLKHGVESASAGYRTGGVSFLEWMEIVMKILEARIAAIGYELSAQRAVSKIMMLRGSANIPWETRR